MLPTVIENLAESGKVFLYVLGNLNRQRFAKNLVKYHILFYFKQASRQSYELLTLSRSSINFSKILKEIFFE